MIPRTSALFAVLLFALSFCQAARGQDRPSKVQFDFKAITGEKVRGQASLHSDYLGESDFDGRVTLVLDSGIRWIVSVSSLTGGDDDNVPQLRFEIRDPSNLQKIETEESSAMEPVEIFTTTRNYVGPGTYKLVSQNDVVLSVTIRDDAWKAESPEK